MARKITVTDFADMDPYITYSQAVGIIIGTDIIPHSTTILANMLAMKRRKHTPQQEGSNEKPNTKASA